MLGALRPGHFTDVHQAFDPLLQFNKRAVIGHADYSSMDMRADGITMLGIEPGIGRELFEAQRHPLLVPVKLEHFHLNLIANIYQITRMRKPSPRHICNVQQTVNAAQVHERAIVGQILHHPRQNRALLQVFQHLRTLFILLLLQKLLARNDNVAALLVQLHNGNREALPFDAVQVAHRPQFNLRSRQKCARPVDVNSYAPLGPLHYRRLNGLILAVRLLDLVPCAQPLRL